MWSWVSRGLVSIEQIATWHFDSDIEAADQALSATPGAMAKLCAVDEVPKIDDTNERAEVQNAQNALLDGEQQSVWAIMDAEDSEAEPVTLPLWFTQPIQKTILVWKKEAEVWNERISKRMEEGKNGLTPKMQSAYDEWNSTNERTIVLDKTRQALVVNLAKKKLSKLRKDCIMLVIHMSRIADDLRIRAGSGKLWKLQLLRGTATVPISDAVPADLDRFEGHQRAPNTTQYGTRCILQLLLYLIWFQHSVRI